MGRHAAGHEFDAKTVQIAVSRPPVQRDAPRPTTAQCPRSARPVWLGAAAAAVAGLALATVASTGDRAATSSTSAASAPSIDYSDPAVAAYLAAVGGYLPASQHPDVAVLAGHQACQWYAEGYTSSEVMTAVTSDFGSRLGSPDMSGVGVADWAGPLATSAMLNFCPEAGTGPAMRY